MTKLFTSGKAWDDWEARNKPEKWDLFYLYKQDEQELISYVLSDHRWNFINKWENEKDIDKELTLVFGSEWKKEYLYEYIDEEFEKEWNA